ncbi:MAG: tetratricopeptide repeat protein [Acetobacteraceae bacterium]|nr:tetratricopeptide repeat protein [Acetobacteraceae bacterium]
MRGLALVVTGALLLLGACSRSHDGDSVVVREPDTASRMHIAATAAAAGQTDIALSMYEAAAAAAPDDPEVQARLVSMLLKAGKPGPAEQALSRALSRKPNNPVLLRWLGNLRLETGSAQEAMDVFDNLLSRDSKNLAALNGRGVALDLLGQHDAAQQVYRTARAIAPQDVQTANNLAVSYLLSDRPAQARDILLPLARQSNLPPRILNNLAIAEAAIGTGQVEPGITATIDSGDLRTMAASFGGSAPADSPSLAPAPEAKPAG